MKERKPLNIKRNISGVPALKARVWQAVRGFGIRRLRYIGQAKTHLQQVVSATAINFVRVNNWLHEVPVAKTRRPLFARVMREKSWQNRIRQQYHRWRKIYELKWFCVKMPLRTMIK